MASNLRSVMGSASPRGNPSILSANLVEVSHLASIIANAVVPRSAGARPPGGSFGRSVDIKYIDGVLKELLAS